MKPKGCPSRKPPSEFGYVCVPITIQINLVKSRFQLEESTETIQSMFVRRMRKQASLKQHLSMEIMSSIFEDGSTRPPAPTSHYHHPPPSMLDLHHHHPHQRSGPGVIPVSEVVGSDDEGGRSRVRDDDYDELTEASTDDDGEADAATEAETASSSGKHRHAGV